MSEEKKIFIDEDWKSQVEAEKAAAEAAAEGKTSSADATGMKFPEASFELLVSTFATEAMVALGQFPNPMDNSMHVDLDHAKYAIDMLEMIEDKTKGNLSEPEAGMIESVLHQLRMAFVAIRSGAIPSGDVSGPDFTGGA